MLKGLCKAQSFGEYTIMISLAIAAVMAMMFFVQRGVQARVNDTRGYMLHALNADMLNIHLSRNGTLSNFAGVEYEPYYQNKETDSEIETEQNIFFNGTTGLHRSEDKRTTRISINTQELPAEDL